VNTVVISASEEAKKIGNIRVQNIILLGKLAKFLNLKKANWNEILKNNIKEKYIDINLQAFETGLNF
jgi:indolepyruvate ferredoxin oxidoreductase beta subunit